MYNSSECCCMCLKNKTLLYNLNMIDREDKIKLIEKLNFCVFEKDHIEENVTRNICDDCKHHVKSSYKFKMMCLKNYNTLKNHVTQRKYKINNSQSTVNNVEKTNKTVEHRKSVSSRNHSGKSKYSERCISRNKNSSKYIRRKTIEHRKAIATIKPFNEKYFERNKIVEHRKSISISNPFLETRKPMETESNNEYNKKCIQYGQTKTSDQQTTTSKQELLRTPSNLESNKHQQINNRKVSTAEQEFIVNHPKETINNVTSNQNETCLSFNKKYYGFTMSEIQSAHEYLFNIKILLKLVTVSTVIDSFNSSEVLNTKIGKRNRNNLYRKGFKLSSDIISKTAVENHINSTNSAKLIKERNKVALEINNNDSNCMKQGFEEKSEDVYEFIDNKMDEDTTTALQNEEMITQDHEGKRAFPAPRADDKIHQIHPFISKQIESAKELSKIVSNPKPLKRKTHMVPILPTESLKPENLGNSFKQFNKAMNDVRNTLNRNADYECQFCDRTFNRKQFLLLHYIVHCEREGSLYRCPICKDAFEDEKTIKHHLTTHYSKPTPRCYICKKVFTREYALALHILSSHKGIRSFQCHICQKSFARNSTLTVHLRSHTAYKGFQCKVCGKFLSQKVGLQRHMAIHTGQKPYACKICENSFAYRSQLTDHIIRIHYNKEFN